MRTSRLEWIERLEPRRLLALSLLADFNGTTAASNPYGFVQLGAVELMFLDDGVHGGELWQTAGTAPGTVMIRDINPGPGSSGIGDISVAGGLAYFSACEASGAINVWRTDGTAAGTIRLANSTSHGQFNIGPVADLNGIAIFASSSYGLWRSDGTPGGTFQIATLYANNFARFGNDLCFFGHPIGRGSSALWKTDGTAAGTTLVRQFSGLTYSNVYAANGRLYFWADDGSGAGAEPWSSDGTAAGTVRLGDLAPGTTSSSVADLIEYHGAAYFISRTTSKGDRLTLYHTDGTAGSATVVADLGSVGTYNRPDLIIYKDLLYFGSSGTGLWRSDGTPGGTGVFLSSSNGGISGPGAFQIYKDRLFFEARPTAGGYEMYSTDGTLAGTMLLKEIAQGSRGIVSDTYYEPAPFVLNGRMYFRADDLIHGTELWSTDGTPEGTYMLEDANTNTNDFRPGVFTPGPGGFSYFTASDGVHGVDLWKTDGTANGTAIVKDLDVIGAGYPRVTIGPMVYLNGLLVFAAAERNTGLELWRSDGTATGTFVVKDLAPGSGSGLRDSKRIKVGQRVFFAASETGSPNDLGLWVSDGTAAETTLVKPRSSTFTMNHFTGGEYQGKLIFHVETNNGSVWISDGTDAGTVKLVGNLSDSTADNWIEFNGREYFTERTTAGQELWSSDGTPAGTAMVADLAPGQSSSDPANFVVSGDYLYFNARSDGSADLWRIDQGGNLQRLTTSLDVQQVRSSAAGGVLLAAGRGVYRFDGSALINLSSAAGAGLLGSANGLDYFAVPSAEAGSKLWMTDGTPAGTVMVSDVPLAAAETGSEWLGVINDTVYVAGWTKAYGQEIYHLPSFARLNADGSLTLEGTISNDLLSLNLAGNGIAASLFGAAIAFPNASVNNGIHIVGGGSSGAIGDRINISGGSLALRDDLGAAGPVSLAIAADAAVTFRASQRLASLSITGRANLAAGGNRVLLTSSLSMPSPGLLDLADNALILDYTGASALGSWDGSRYTGITALVAAGIAPGSAPGITSSLSDGARRTIGAVEARQALGISGTQTGTFAGQTVDSTAVLVRLTWAGDANLDGMVDARDLGMLAGHWQLPGGGFGNGDYNYDGVVDVIDMGLLAMNWQHQRPLQAHRP